MADWQHNKKFTTSQHKTPSQIFFNIFPENKGHWQETPKSSTPPIVLHFMGTSTSSRRENLVTILPWNSTLHWMIPLKQSEKQILGQFYKAKFLYDRIALETQISWFETSISTSNGPKYHTIRNPITHYNNMKSTYTLNHIRRAFKIGKKKWALFIQY